MRALVPFFRALTAMVLGALALDCAPTPGLGLQAPGLLRQALDVVADLGAAATLVPRGGAPLPALQLVRGEDGVTFTGFLDATPGEYTLEVVFTGVIAGEDESARVFLGRLGSDPFTVTQGQGATPRFSQPLDTVGRDGDGGDEDGDGLGLLLELLLGTSPLARDSDNDGVEDGLDCSPDDVTNATPIAEGGSLGDCDADGFDTALPLLGEPGDDCDDGNASVHPGADDDCGTLEDSDCNPATCPVSDAEGPVVVLVTPAAGEAAGCQAELIVAASDPSEVLGVSATLPDRPITGGYVRTLIFADNGDGTWSSLGLNATGPGLVDGNERLLIQASDGRGNSSSTEASLQVALGFPAVTWDAPPSLGAEPLSITVTPQGPRPLTVLEIRSAPLDANGLINPTTMSTVATLPVGGGSAAVDPATLSGSVAIFPYALDDVGNVLVPYAQSMPMSGSTTADYRCDGATHSIPASVRIAGRGRVTALHYLQDALVLMGELDPTQELVKIILFGLESDGTIDLSSSDYIFLAYYFNDAGGGNGKSVSYYSSAPSYGSQPFPTVNENDGSLSDGNAMDPTDLVDSDAVVAAWPCGGNGPTGQGTDDMIMYIRNDGNAFDSIFLSTSDDWTWGVHADDLGTPTFGCSPP
ncbi:MAG: putative metal-binding motif-containing protein [Deltaproteobacteria bacterium]|nr:putative metal-binding motif-containing protein [Deltaproteobacteria bacterium]